MVQHPRSAYRPTDPDRASGPSSGQPAPRAQGQLTPVRTRTEDQVVVLEVAGPLGSVVEDLTLSLQLALAEGPRGVVCDLSAVPAGSDAGAVDVLAEAGKHVRDWPGIPVSVASTDQAVREALGAHPLGELLMVTASVPAALSAVLASPIPLVEWLRLAPHPTAPRASRDFVTRTLMAWGLDAFAPAACLVISELVTNSTVHAGTDVVLSVAACPESCPEAVRLTVRDNSAELPKQQDADLGLHGRGLILVAGFCRAFGVLPTAQGGKVVWAVIDATAANTQDVPTTAAGVLTSHRYGQHGGDESSVPISFGRWSKRNVRISAPPGGAMTNRVIDEAERLMSPAEVAALFRVDPKTVTRWANAGKITSLRTLGGHRRYRESEVRHLLEVPIRDDGPVPGS